MNYSIFPKPKNNPLTEPMFLGQPVNVARYDQQKHPIFEQLIERQLSFFWRPEEIDVSRDRRDFAELAPHEQHIFLSNLKYQTLLDSIQGRSPNAVLLPLVSIPELETWIETWSFSECVAETTEVLTPNGWKDISLVTTDDEVLVYDLNTETTWFEKPKRTTNYQIDNRLMVELVANNPKQFHQFVTPNHRMPVKTRVKQGQNPTKQFVEAGLWDFKPHHLAPVSGNTIQEGSDLTAIERLLIVIQADGNMQDRYTGKRVGTVPVWFDFSKQAKIDRLFWLAKEANIVITQLVGSEQKGNIKAKHRFKIDLPLEHLPNDVKDFSTWVNLKEFSAKKAEQFLDEVSYWDSHIHISKKGEKSFTYTSCNKTNTDVIQALACMCGKQARYTKRQDNRKDSYQDVHSVNVVNNLFKDGQSIKKNLVPYTGKVYCIETSCGAFVIRYKNTVSVTGNTIHSRSYTHIIRNVLHDPSVVFDDIMDNEHILKRAEDIAVYYDDLYEVACLYNMYGQSAVDLFDLKKKLYLCLMAVNVLEAIRFYVSFACSFAFAERKQMEGNAKIIRLIARDEALHLNGTQAMINLMRSGKDDPQMVEVAKACQEEAIKIFQTASQQEKDWADYLFKDGSMIGLNKQILSQYIDYITNVRMSAIGLPKLFANTANPIPWINNWLSSDNVQVAPQESEISNYLVSQIDNRIAEEDFSDFSDI